MTTQLFLKTRDAANLLNISYSGFCRLRLSGEGPPYLLIGGSIRYPLDKLDAWLAAKNEEAARAILGGKPETKISAKRVDGTEIGEDL